MPLPRLAHALLGYLALSLLLELRVELLYQPIEALHFLVLGLAPSTPHCSIRGVLLHTVNGRSQHVKEAIRPLGLG